MHRDEVKIFRGNVETHLTRLREIERRQEDDDRLPPVAQPAGARATGKPPLDYEPSAKQRRRKRILAAVMASVSDTLAMTLLGTMLGFLIGYAFGASDGESVPDAVVAAGLMVGVGAIVTLVLVRRRLCQ